MSDPILHLTGPILTGAGRFEPEAWVVDGRMTYRCPEVPGRELAGPVIPGLADLHCHIGLDGHGAVDDETTVQQALAERAAGVLLTRDCGLPRDTRFLEERRDLPRTVRCGRHLARPKRYNRNFAWEIEPEQLVEFTIAQAEAGDGWVKLLGDWIDRGEGDLATCWPLGVLKDAITAAHDHGARVTAHCFAEQSLVDIAEAGIDCIEHGSGLDEEMATRFAEQGIAVVPTLVNIAEFPSHAAAGEAKFPRYAAHMRDLHARRYETYQMAYEAGVQLYAGTDAGGGIAHGRIADEVAELGRVMPAERALGAATWDAREYLRRPLLAEGDPADLVVLRSDPREDLAALREIQAVVLDGVVVEGSVG